MTSQAVLRRIELDIGELLERHETGRDLRDFERYADDPVGFIRDVLKGEPWSRQVAIAEAVRDCPLVVVRSNNSAGKDWIAAQLALWWVYCRRGMVLMTGPTERQVVEVCMAEVGRAFRRAKDLPGELYRTALRLPTEDHAGIIAFTSTEASRLTGFHAPLVMAVITEAQGVEDFAFEGLLSCATGPEDRLLAVGNPLLPSGRFYNASRASGWHSIQVAASEHPNVVEGRQVIPGGPSREFVERIRSEYGEDSPIYQARVLGEFPDQGEHGLFRRSWLDAAAERWEEQKATVADETPTVAIDPARFGPDETVVAVRRGSVLTDLISWSKADLMESVERLREVFDRIALTPGNRPTPRFTPGVSVAGTWGSRGGKHARLAPVGRVIVDEVGLGGGCADRLRELGYGVEGFNGGSRPEDSERFLNRRAESYWRLRELLEAGEIALPADEELAEELLTIKWRPTAEGKIRLESKDDLKGRLGRSPDRADSVSMAFGSDRKTVNPSWRSKEDRLRYARFSVR